MMRNLREEWRFEMFTIKSISEEGEYFLVKNWQN